MPTESDKIISEKITSMDVLPVGTQLNSYARWQQIEHTLQPGKKRNTRWYYAAAILIGVAATLPVWNKEAEKPVAANISNQNISHKKPVTIIAKRLIAPKKNIPVAIHLKKVQPPAVPVESLSATIAATQNTTTAGLHTDQVIEIPAIVKTIQLPVIATNKASVKPKKLKIVHLNELGTEQEISYTHSPLKKIQAPDELSDESSTPQINKAWWQPKPKPVTTITDHP